ncbi:hypothetical protein [Novosphingobium sp.]|uniref:hypothetical protein n=1 Tax=Novosphingobium sp. TaxID=1874826 RepID=UPI00286CC082|nr:hypothetical protein [Novosphingobium sp.]
MTSVAWQALHYPAGVQGIYEPGSNVVECAADMLWLLGHNMPPIGSEMEVAQ